MNERRFHETLKVLGALVVSGLVIAAAVINYTEPKFKSFKTPYWNNRAGYFKAPTGTPQQNRLTSDVLTPEGWHGNFVFADSSQRLEMNLVDAGGEPVGGLHVAATIAGAGKAKVRAHQVLALEPDGRYRSDELNLNKGRWDFTIIARDYDVESGAKMRFRVEKQITIE